MILQAYSKLNAETNMYPDLIGIDVSENDLLSRVVEEQSNRAKICEVAEKAEVSSVLFYWVKEHKHSVWSNEVDNLNFYID